MASPGSRAGPWSASSSANGREDGRRCRSMASRRAMVKTKLAADPRCGSYRRPTARAARTSPARAPPPDRGHRATADPARRAAPRSGRTAPRGDGRDLLRRPARAGSRPPHPYTRHHALTVHWRRNQVAWRGEGDDPGVGHYRRRHRPRRRRGSRWRLGTARWRRRPRVAAVAPVPAALHPATCLHHQQGTWAVPDEVKPATFRTVARKVG